MKKTELIDKIKKKEKINLESKQAINLYKEIHKENYPSEYEDLFYKNYMVEITYKIPLYCPRWVEKNPDCYFSKGHYTLALT